MKLLLVHACLAVLAATVAIPPLALAKPPDLPQNPRIIVSPLWGQNDSDQVLPLPLGCTRQEEGIADLGTPAPISPEYEWSEAFRELVNASLFLDVDPLIGVWAEAGAVVAEPADAVPPVAAKQPVQKVETPQPVSPCPYVRKQTADKNVNVLSDTSMLRSVMENLESLEKAAEGIEKARELGKAGHYCEALECLEKARTLCPGSSYEKRIDEVFTEIVTTADTQSDKEETEAAEEQEEQPEGCGCCCCWGALNQFGMCWMSQLADWCQKQQVNCESSDPNKRILELLNNSEDLRKIENEWERIWFNDQPTHLTPECVGGIKPESVHDGIEETACANSPCCPVEAMLYKPVTLSFQGEPLSKVLQSIASGSGLLVVIDEESLKAAGLPSLDDMPVTINVEGMPLRVAFDVLLRPSGLKAEVKGCAIHIAAIETPHQAGGEEASEDAPQAKMCGSVCPKCEALHRAKCAGIEEQVTGLMKACYLAIGDGRFEKAADLAREAHALDPERVEGDPIIYKLHLLNIAENCANGWVICPSKTSGAEAPCEPACGKDDKGSCDDPGLSLQPDLPGVSSEVVNALDEVLTDKDELGKKGEEENTPHGSFSLGLGLDTDGLSLGFLPETETLKVSLGCDGLHVRGTVPCCGASCNFFYCQGVFLMWKTPAEAKAE